MSCSENLIKQIQTTSGTRYIYSTETNQIITLSDSAGVLSDSEAIDELKEAGILSGISPKRILLPMNPKEYAEAISSKIPHLVLELTQQCTLRCQYCVYSGNYTGVRTHSEKSMDYDTIRKSIVYYFSHNRDYSDSKISFYGGEALIEFEKIKYAVNYAKTQNVDQKPLTFSISTNGTMLSRSVLQWLSENTDVSVTITLNGSGHDQYRRFPHGAGSLDVIMQALYTIRTDFPSLWDRIHFIANVSSYSELLQLREFYQQYIHKPPVLITGIHSTNGNDIIQTICTIPETDVHAKEKVVHLYESTYDEYIKSWFDMDIEDIIVRDISPIGHIRTCNSFCMPFTTSLFVSAEGTFGMCEKVGANAELGNIQTGINTGKVLLLLEKTQSLLNNKCLNCWAQRLCGVCFEQLHIDDTGQLTLPDNVCETIRQNIEESLIMFCEIGEINPKLIEEIRGKYTRNEL